MRYLTLGLLVCVAANAAPIEFQSSQRQTALVELYTSEGCSSCPPAESWLSGLKEKPALWSDFVPVAFHIDYWDYLGWRDQWSSQQYSDRQREYAKAWGSENIYTPEFVLNGKEWHNWLGLKVALALRGSKAGILKVASEDTHHWNVNYIPFAAGTTGYEVQAALLVSGLGLDVKAGENAGHHLKHDFVALQLINAPLIGKEGEFHGNFVMEDKPGKPEGRLALAVWAMRNGTLEPVQAVGGWLTAFRASEPAASLGP
jgi:hypothetical protein